VTRRTRRDTGRVVVIGRFARSDMSLCSMTFG
jgi:hypothetical protein